MALNQDSDTIDGIKITTVQYPPVRLARFQARLAKTLAPAISSMKGMDTKVLAKMVDMDVATAGPVLAAVFAELDEKTVDFVIKESLGGSYVVVVDSEGKDRRIELTKLDEVDRAFEGKLATMYKAIWFALKVNFADFFDGAFAKFRAALAASQAEALAKVATPATPKE